MKGVPIPCPLKIKLGIANATRDVNEENELKAYVATIRDGLCDNGRHRKDNQCGEQEQDQSSARDAEAEGSCTVTLHGHFSYFRKTVSLQVPLSLRWLPVREVLAGKRMYKELWTVGKVGESRGGRTLEARATGARCQEKWPILKSCEERFVFFLNFAFGPNKSL